MKLGIMQPYFFPYLGYWQLINAVDKYVVYDDVTFIKGGWISRNNILLNGTGHMITLQLDNASSFRNINEIAISVNVKARTKILKTIEQAYKKAPFYEKIMPMLENLIMNSKMISELNYEAILCINHYIGIDTEILLSSQIEKDCSLKGEEKVIHICNRLGADAYYNAIGGIELYHQAHFLKNNLELFFVKMRDVSYKQYDNEFVPNLSIIDVLMFNPVEKIRTYLNEYDLLTGR